MAELGIEPCEEDEFAWIAEVGLQTAPPSRWVSRYDSVTCATYFVDTDTQISTWDNPLLCHLRKVVDVGRMYLLSPQDSLFEEQKQMIWGEHKADLEGWHGPIEDGEGNSYFVNSKDGISSWQDPRIGSQYVFDVQCGLLRHMENIMAIEEQDDDGFFGGGTPWETEDGAQVMTVEGCTVPRAKPGRKVARVNRAMDQAEDISFTLRRMGTEAEWLHDTRRNEEEVQRLRLIRKVEERRVRKLSRKLTKAIQDTVQADADENVIIDDGRRMAWSTQGKVAAARSQSPLQAACANR